MSDTPKCDWILVGGGLQSGLIALAVLDRDPNARLVVIEREGRLGGNHTWSYHEGYLPEAARAWFAPLVEHRWPRHRVRFPGLERVLDEPYATTSSERFDAVVQAAIAAAPNAALMLNEDAIAVGATEVTLASGARLLGGLVVDARGPAADEIPAESGYQKFVGLEVALEDPLDPDCCDLIDATVPQDDGFRFFYVLPFGPKRALVEDTRFSNHAHLDREQVRGEVLRYCEARGLRVREVLREEHGVLPMPWKVMATPSLSAPLVAGYRGGWFHPATGYSVPVALRLALHLAAVGPNAAFGPEYRTLAADQERQAHFGHLLNELLFTATDPERRWQVFRHFYGLPEPLILRFYGLQMSRADRLRFFFRRPPPGVRFGRALRILPAWAMGR